MKFYLDALYKSFTSPLWLASQSKATSKAATFFVLITLVLSIGVGAHVAYREIPKYVPNLKRNISEHVPNFTADIRSGELTITDLPQPYTDYFTDTSGDEFVIAIDTMTTGTVSIDSFFTSTTDGGILITRWGIVSKGLDSQKDMDQTFAQVPDISFSKIKIIEFLDNVESKFRPAIFAALIAATFAIWGLGLIIFVLIFSTIAFAVYSGVSKHTSTQRYSWKEIFTFSLFVFGLPKLVVEMVSIGFSTSFPYLVFVVMTIGLIRVLSIPKESIEQQDSSGVQK